MVRRGIGRGGAGGGGTGGRALSIVNSVLM